MPKWSSENDALRAKRINAQCMMDDLRGFLVLVIYGISVMYLLK
jgi:hypothetical protein